MLEIKKVVTVYAESTPNPASLKFVANRFLLDEGSVEYVTVEEAKNCPLATQLFAFDGVASVFIASNFITINKKATYDWHDLMPLFREFIKVYLESGEPIFSGPAEQKADEKIENTVTTGKIESKIIEMLDEYIKPAVEGDGGAIHFKSFADGKVTLVLKGACSGCPSSLVTLKGGIERLLKQFIPEVHEVVAEEQ
jgi:NFU1 iron-sulfur cluster scaffold homolog, mitochondrial